ncbi:MAG TPA: DUF1326 domain-containing protein [Bauldia sp.]|nr:DUF1326 domain-containing protein [Bauldia sp.]
MIDWRIDAIAFSNCNCDYCCPCQFELRPTHDACRGFEVGRIERGHFGDVRLDGLCYAVTYAWPGAIFEGNGEMQIIIDERATEPQRAALETVLGGGETEEAKTHWWVFRAMSSTVHNTLFLPIELDVDIEARTARAVVGGLLESAGRPIVSPATGENHRVRIQHPAGIEFEVAEIGSASTRATGKIKLDLRDSYGQFNKVRHTGHGVVRTLS